MGNLVSDMLTGFFVFVFVEYQLHSLVNVLILKRISHYSMLKRYYRLQGAFLQEWRVSQQVYQPVADVKLAQVPSSQAKLAMKL